VSGAGSVMSIHRHRIWLIHHLVHHLPRHLLQIAHTCHSVPTRHAASSVMWRLLQLTKQSSHCVHNDTSRVSGWQASEQRQHVAQLLQEGQQREARCRADANALQAQLQVAQHRLASMQAEAQLAVKDAITGGMQSGCLPSPGHHHTLLQLCSQRHLSCTLLF
jgi:hypothetical protein